MTRRHVLRVEGLEVESPYLRWSRAAARWFSRWRAELAVLLVGWVLYLLARSVTGVFVARILVIVGVAGLLAWPASRGYLGRTVVRWWTRHRFLVAVRRLALVSDFDRSPTVGRVRDVPAGQLLDVRVPPGLTAVDLEDRAEALAVCLEVRDVRVKRDPDNAARSVVTVVRRDPLAAMEALPWPLAEAERGSLWEPIPVAVDEDGSPVTVRLPERNVIFGGEPGAGKSVAQSLPVAAAALDRDVDLYLFDGNQVEFAPWAACATRTVGPDMGQAVDVLGEVAVEMDARYAVLLGGGRRKIAPGDGMRLIVVAVNELAFYTATGDRKQRAEFAYRLRDLVARGRAAGIIVLAATQRPSSDVVPTSLRDLFGFRWALRCSTPDASDTILGRGWATAGVSATDIPAKARGVGYLLAEGGQPVRCKAYYLDDDTIHAIAARGAVLRGRGPHGLAA
jgi:FtsK/SpoIIIE family